MAAADGWLPEPDEPLDERRNNSSGFFWVRLPVEDDGNPCNRGGDCCERDWDTDGNAAAAAAAAFAFAAPFAFAAAFAVDDDANQSAAAAAKEGWLVAGRLFLREARS